MLFLVFSYVLVISSFFSYKKTQLYLVLVTALHQGVIVLLDCTEVIMLVYLKEDNSTATQSSSTITLWKILYLCRVISM